MRGRGARNRADLRGLHLRGLRPRVRWPVALPLIVLLLAIGAAGLSERAALLDSPSSVPSWAPYVLIGASLGGVLLAVVARRAARRLAALEIGGLLALVVGVVVAILVFRPDDKKGPQSTPTATATATPTATGRSGDGSTGPSAVSWPWLELGLVVAGIALVAVILLVLARWHGPPETPTEEELAERARTAVAAGRAALREAGDDREAVIACYAAMEAALAGQGVRRQAADTPSDVLSRAAAAGLLSPEAAAAANELAGLFHHARFSTAPLPSDAVTAAEGSLARIGHELDVRVTAGVEHP